MKDLLRYLLVFTTTFTLAWTAPAAPRAEHVFIISFDQGDPALIEQAPMPTFHALASEGARTWTAYTIVPSLTLPAHTSMLTGVGPQAHQILWNDYEPDKGQVKVPTIFSLAKQHGLVTAMFVGKEKFQHLNLPGTVDAFVWPQPEDDAKAVAKAFARQVGTLNQICASSTFVILTLPAMPMEEALPKKSRRWPIAILRLPRSRMPSRRLD